MTKENKHLLIGVAVGVAILWLLSKRRRHAAGSTASGGSGGSTFGGGASGCGCATPASRCVGIVGPLGNYAQGAGPMPPVGWTPDYTPPSSTNDHDSGGFHLALDFDVEAGF